MISIMIMKIMITIAIMIRKRAMKPVKDDGREAAVTTMITIFSNDNDKTNNDDS